MLLNGLAVPGCLHLLPEPYALHTEQCDAWSAQWTTQVCNRGLHDAEQGWACGAGLERTNSQGSGYGGAGMPMEPVGEHRELGGSGWGSAMKILGEMERDMERDATSGDLSDRYACDAAPGKACTRPFDHCGALHVGL